VFGRATITLGIGPHSICYIKQIFSDCVCCDVAFFAVLCCWLTLSNGFAACLSHVISCVGCVDIMWSVVVVCRVVASERDCDWWVSFLGRLLRVDLKTGGNVRPSVSRYVRSSIHKKFVRFQ